MKYETIVCPFCGNGHAHITYEENRVYQMNCPDCHNAIFHRDTSWDNAVSFFKRMVIGCELCGYHRAFNGLLSTKPSAVLASAPESAVKEYYHADAHEKAAEAWNRRAGEEEA